MQKIYRQLCTTWNFYKTLNYKGYKTTEIAPILSFMSHCNN